MSMKYIHSRTSTSYSRDAAAHCFRVDFASSHLRMHAGLFVPQRLHAACTTSVCSIPRSLSSAIFVGDLSSWLEHFPRTSLRLVYKEDTRPTGIRDAPRAQAHGMIGLQRRSCERSHFAPLAQASSAPIPPSLHNFPWELGTSSPIANHCCAPVSSPSHRGCLLCGMYQISKRYVRNDTLESTTSHIICDMSLLPTRCSST